MLLRRLSRCLLHVDIFFASGRSPFKLFLLRYRLFRNTLRFGGSSRILFECLYDLLLLALKLLQLLPVACQKPSLKNALEESLVLANHDIFYEILGRTQRLEGKRNLLVLLII